MGVCGSKDVDEKEARKIDSEFARLHIPKFDEFFDKASSILSRAEGIRFGLQDAREDAAEQAGTWQLKEYKYVETIKVLFWTLSANGGGDISKSKAGVQTEAPFIVLEYFDGLQYGTRLLADSFQAFLKSITSAPIEIPKMLQEILELIKQGEELSKTAKDEATAAGLNALQAGKAALNFGKNLAKIKSESAKIEKIKPLAEDGVKEFKELLPQLKEVIAQADEVGKPAHEAVCRVPTEVFEKFHKGERKTKEDIEKEKKAAEAAKAKKDKKNKDKKEGKKEEPKKEEKK